MEEADPEAMEEIAALLVEANHRAQQRGDDFLAYLIGIALLHLRERGTEEPPRGPAG